ncbi:MAG: cytochrome c [Gammaproteobacteria bacterium]|nr:cytochrome c [Gammaproteobacteria bacterium]
MLGMVSSWTATAAQDADEASRIEAGRRLYATGTVATGQDVQARVSGNVPLSGHSAACSNCHRPSGLGAFEGTTRSLPITGPALFSERPSPPSRPAYDDDALLRAITTGTSASGRSLNPLMPRYRLGHEDAANLVAYLHHLGADPVPGVDEQEVVIATVIAESAPESERQAVTAVLERFVEIKNAGTRHEARRAAASLRHRYGERQARGYRRWRLLRWELKGAPESWPTQLAALYAADPPFLLLSGTAGDQWRVLHAFCEQQRMPCVLPITDDPPAAEGDFYSVYFNSGARLEGLVTALHLRRQFRETMPRVVVVRPDTDKARTASESFRQAVGSDNSPAVQEEILRADAITTRDYWRRLLQRAQPDALVIWVDQQRLVGLDEALARHPGALAIYAAAAFSDGPLRSPMLAKSNAWFVQPFSPPITGRPAFPREAAWLKSQHLEHLDPVAASQALFACHVAGEQMMQLVGNYSREYFMEGLEHMLDSTNMTSIIPRTTLGQGQRFISRGAYVLPASSLVRGDGAGATWVEQ